MILCSSRTEEYQTMTEALCFNFCGGEFRNNNVFYYGTLDCVTGCSNADLSVASASVLTGSRLTGEPIYTPVSPTDPDSLTSTGYTVVTSPNTFVTTTSPDTAAAALGVGPSIPLVPGMTVSSTSTAATTITTPSSGTTPVQGGTATTTLVRSKKSKKSPKGFAAPSFSPGGVASTVVGGPPTPATTFTPVKSKKSKKSPKGFAAPSSSPGGVASTVLAPTFAAPVTPPTPVKSKKKKSPKGFVAPSSSPGGVASTVLAPTFATPATPVTPPTPVKSKKQKSPKGTAAASISTGGVAATTLVGGTKSKGKGNRSPPRTAPASLAGTVGTGTFDYTLITDLGTGTTIDSTIKVDPPATVSTVAATTLATTGGANTGRWWYTQDANGVGHIVNTVTGSSVSQVINPAPAPVIGRGSIDPVTVAGTVGATVTHPSYGQTASASVTSCSKGKGYGCGRSRQSRAYSYEALVSSTTSPTMVVTGAVAVLLWSIL